MIDREKIIEQAYVECMCEMYAKAQPSADYKKLLEDVKNGKITDSPYDPVYSRYYLSYEEYKYTLHSLLLAPFLALNLHFANANNASILSLNCFLWHLFSV